MGFLFLCSRNAVAQSVDKEPAAIVELGAAAAAGLQDGAWSFGPSAAVEVTPIERWLELEAGVTPVFGPHPTEWDTDLLFKKPWTLSERMELMAGAGLEWIRTTEHNVRTDSIRAEVALDFMYWPGFAKHEFGWYLEPGVEYNFGRGHERSLGITGGLLIAIRKAAKSAR